MNSDEEQEEEDNFKCPGCPGFGSYRCCQTYGDYHHDYLEDLKREETEMECMKCGGTGWIWTVPPQDVEILYHQVVSLSEIQRTCPSCKGDRRHDGEDGISSDEDE